MDFIAAHSSRRPRERSRLLTTAMRLLHLRPVHCLTHRRCHFSSTPSLGGGQLELISARSCALTLWILGVGAHATYAGAEAAPVARCGL